MKDFNDFWCSLTEEDFLYISSEVNDSTKSMMEETANPKNLLGNQVAIASLTLIKGLLSKYHEWLSEQL